MLPNIEFGNAEFKFKIYFYFLFQEINSKEISKIFESNSLWIDMELKVSEMNR